MMMVRAVPRPRCGCASPSLMTRRRSISQQPMMLLQGRCQGVIVTLGAEGVWLVTGEDAVHFPAPAVTVVDTTGAGDCFCGVLAAGLAQGLDLEAAIARAVAAASLSVMRSGAAPAMPRAQDLGVA